MKRYVTWKRKKITNNCYIDPNTDNKANEETNGQATFTETPYQSTNGRFISFVEYGDECSEEQIEYFRTIDPDFEFTFIDEFTANTLLLESYGGDVTVYNFVFTDNRPTDI